MSFLADVKAYVALRSPDTVQDSRFDGLVSSAEKQLSECVFGDMWAIAGALMVLHWLTLDGRGGSGGAIKKEKEGQLEREYMASTESMGYWGGTSWGQELQQLKKNCVFGPRTRMMCALCR